MKNHRQDRHVRSRAHVSKTELRGHLTGRPEHRGRPSQLQPQRRARVSGRRRPVLPLSPSVTLSPALALGQYVVVGTGSLQCERSTGQTRGEWGAARCDHSRPGAEGLKRPVLDARTSPQAFPRLLTVPSPAHSRDCVNASIRFLTEAQSRAFRDPGLDSAPPAMPRPGMGPP